MAYRFAFSIQSFIWEETWTTASLRYVLGLKCPTARLFCWFVWVLYLHLTGKEGRECMIYGFYSKVPILYEWYGFFCIHNVRTPTPDTRVNIPLSLLVFHFCIFVLLFLCVLIIACIVGKACLFWLTNKIFEFEFVADGTTTLPRDVQYRYYSYIRNIHNLHIIIRPWGQCLGCILVKIHLSRCGATCSLVLHCASPWRRTRIRCWQRRLDWWNEYCPGCFVVVDRSEVMA